MNSERTIAAAATPLGRGAIAIIRLSGSKSLEIADKVIFIKSLDSFRSAEQRRMYLGSIISNRISENCMAVCYKAPSSYTGEDMVEIYCHGGIRLVKAILDLIYEAGASQAENGEFTKRAFLNGKMGLADSEGVIDMINAESEAEIKASYRLMSGNLTRKIVSYNKKLLNAISGLEASLDYPEELEEDTRAEAKHIIVSLIEELRILYGTKDMGKIIKDGVSVAIVGAPNAGKSSLLNAILLDERAIVSDMPGTTRDIISESIEFRGIKFNLLDTAGLREGGCEVERKGIERTLRAISGADVIIKVIDAQNPENIIIAEKKPVITVYNKADLVNVTEDRLYVSCKYSQGIDKVLKKIYEAAEPNITGGEVLVNRRHQEAVKRAIEHLTEVMPEYDTTSSDCILIDLRAAYMALGEIDGSTASENIIDDIFSRFCVGK